MKQSVFRVFIGFLAIGTLIGARELWLRPDGKTHVAFFDVGQGDSALITFANGTRMLVDGGPDWSTLEELGRTLPLFDRRIDFVALSHPNSDHMMSLPEVLRRYRVRTLVTAGTPFDSGRYHATLSGAQLSGTRILNVSAGDRITAGTTASIHVIWPPVPRPPKMNKDVNNDSLTLMVEAGGKKILLTGDLEEIVEKTLIAARANLKADILKVPHHGSRSSSSTGFLLAVDPEIAVISVGRDNSYGHPAPAILRRLQELGIQVRRTDLEGNVHFSW